MRQYLDLMEHVLADGVEKRDRTGTAYSVGPRLNLHVPGDCRGG